MKVLFATSLWPTKKYPQYVIFLKQIAQALKNLGVEISVCVIAKQSENEYIEDTIKVYKVDVQDYRRELKQIILNGNFDIIDTHGIFNYTLIGYLKRLCKKNKIVLIRHIHGLNVFREHYEKYPLYGRFLQIKRKLMYKKYDAIVGVSNKVCDLYKSGMKSNVAYTVYNGVDINKFVPTEKKDNDVVKIICVGNLIKIKGQDYLIRACRKLCDEGITNFHLTLLGRGVEEENLKKLVCDLGLDEFVDFGGYIEYEQVVEKMQESDIFILPSYFEALGCVYLEAMGCKLCTIGCINQGIDEIIVHGENGLLVNERDVASITECLKLVITDKKKRSELAENGYKTIQEYTWAKSAEELIKVYNKTLKMK